MTGTLRLCCEGLDAFLASDIGKELVFTSEDCMKWGVVANFDGIKKAHWACPFCGADFDVTL